METPTQMELAGKQRAGVFLPPERKEGDAKKNSHIKKWRVAFPFSDAPAEEPPPIDHYDPEYFFQEPEPQSYTNWRENIGKKIADYYGKVAESPTRTWTLDSFPKGYRLVRKISRYPGLRRNAQHELYCDKGRKYPSPSQFVEHAVWLCADPELYKEPCQCMHCSAVKQPGSDSKGVVSLQGDNPEDKKWAEFTKKAAASAFQRVWRSDLDRQQELAPAVIQSRLAQVKRKHEIVWVQLDHPVEHPRAPSLRITHWPAMMLGRRLMTGVPKYLDVDVHMQENEHSNDGTTTDYDLEDFELDGRVTQLQLYHICLLGIRQESLVPCEHALPYLAYRPPADLLAAPLSDIDFASVEWLRQDKRPKWQVAPTPEARLFPSSSQEGAKLLKRAPSFAEALPAFFLALAIAGYASTAVVGTNRYTIEPQTPFPSASTMTTTPGGLLGSPTSEMKVSGKELVQRREASKAIAEHWVLPKRYLWSDLSPLYADARTVGNTYFQGAILGAERIWAADVIRLDLGTDERSRLFEEIRERETGAMPAEDLREVLLTQRRALLMDVDAIMLPSDENGLYPAAAPGPSARPMADDKRNLLFCGRVWVALHRRRDAALLARLEPWARNSPFRSGAFPLEWTRPRATLLYTDKLPVPAEMAFVPVLDAKGPHVVALPLACVAGRWQLDGATLAGEDATAQIPYSTLMGKMEREQASDAAAVPRSQVSDLSVQEGLLVLAGWAPGEAAAMRAQSQWGSVYEVHEQADWTAKVEVCDMLERESERRRREGRPGE